MSEALWASPSRQADRARRLLNCGFDCFVSPTSHKDEELRYAEYEFQLYSMHAKWLAHKGPDGVVQRAASQQVCIDLQTLTAGLRLGEAWNSRWDACLDRWNDPADPHGAYVCPVLIDRVDAPSNFPDEHDPAGECDRENVWTITNADRDRFFFARDFSGMFAIANDDPAYRAASGYVPPRACLKRSGCSSAARSCRSCRICKRKALLFNLGEGANFCPICLGRMLHASARMTNGAVSTE